MKREYKYEGDVLILKCNGCGRWLTKECYTKEKNGKFGLASKCVDCKKKYRLENRERLKEYFREYSIANKDKLNEYKREYRILNKDKIAENYREYRDKNREKLALYKKERYENNKESRREYNKNYYEDNKEDIKDRVRRYEKENRDKVYARSKKYKEQNKKRLTKYFKDRYEEKKHEILKQHKERVMDIEEKFGFSIGYFHSKTRMFVKQHHLKPKLCSICGCENKIEIHHPSYENFDKRSEVVFCCRSCHRLIHYGTIKCPQPINLLTYNQLFKG